MHVHKWALEDIMNMLPWEREIYVNLLAEYIKEENRRRKEEAEKAKNRTNR